MDPLGYRGWHRRHLPHWQPDGAVLFVTFRLAGSLPAAVAARWRAEDDWRTADRWLDAGQHGPHWLREPAVARAVAEALHWRDGRVFRLWAYCLMSNHVHVIFEPLPKPADHESDAIVAPEPWGLAAIMQSLKTRTALEANTLLGREGPFWAREYFDHWLRNSRQRAETIDYVLDNPVAAGLVERAEVWPWTWLRPES